MNLLLAVDGSEASRTAEEALARLMLPAQPGVDVLTVAPPVFQGLGQEKTFSQALLEVNAGFVKSVEEDLGRRGFRDVSGVVVSGRDIAGEILARSEKSKADLVVLGARGLSPVKAFLMGSVSARVSRHARTSVLVVRASAQESGGPAMVLACVDGSKASLQALQALSDWRFPPETRLTLFHVIDNVADAGVAGYAGEGFATLAYAYKDLMASSRVRSEKLLAEALALAREHFPLATARSVEGEPASGILEEARVGRYDLIVAGRRGLSGVERFLMGSVSRRVVDHAPCSTLIFQAPSLPSSKKERRTFSSERV
jgi:nucleotide-binding universal stress UspA family protein